MGDVKDSLQLSIKFALVQKQELRETPGEMKKI